jgi:heptosyltransferase-3
VLLSTPLAVSIKAQLPEARVDFLVFGGTEGVLAKNPYVDRVHTIPPGSRSLRQLAALWNRYDYAIGANPSDRTTLFTAVAGRYSLGFSYLRPKEWWKKAVLNECRHCDDRLHLVPLLLNQLEGLGISPRPRVVMGYDDEDREFVRQRLGGQDYVLLHPYSRRPCKYWPAAAWGALAGLVRQRTGLRPIFTVSPDPADRDVLAEILAAAPPGTEQFLEPFTLCQMAAAIKGGRGFVGIDTVVTHMAAALDVPLVAVYGPTMVRHWGPWPNDCTDPAPYRSQGSVQRNDRITIVQKEWPCVPCNRENCEISDCGRIECLAAISPEEVCEELCRVIQP